MVQTSVRTVAGIAAAVAAVSGSYVVYRNRHWVSAALWRWRLSSLVHNTKMRPVVVENIDQWNSVQEELISCCSSLGCVGFDCEWVSVRPVALLQLATHTGLCVLVRLCKLDEIPTALRDLLRDPTVLKVGVGPADDCKRLYNAHSIVVNGALDLREFFHAPPASEKTSSKKGKELKKKKERLATFAEHNIAHNGLRPSDNGQGVINNRTEQGSVVCGQGTNNRSGPLENGLADDELPGLGNVRRTTRDDRESSEETGSSIVASGGGEPESGFNTDEEEDTASEQEDSSNNRNEKPVAPGDCLNGVLVNSNTAQDINSNANLPPTSNTTTANKCEVSANVANEDGKFSKARNSSGNVPQNSPDYVPCACGRILKTPRSSSFKIRPGVNGPTKLGLSSLAEYYLNRTLDKDWRVRASDWEADHFSLRQIKYAAEDARSGLHVMLVLLQHLLVCCCCAADAPTAAALMLAPLCRWSSLTRSMLQTVAGGMAIHSPQGGWDTAGLKKYNPKGESVKNYKSYRRAYSLRKTPLYHNSLLWAPDDQPLCTVDPKKAQWYVDNNLGEVVNKDPFIVRLTFEPTGRPQKEGADGSFYLKERQNMCVVCGMDESYIRKNIVPHEYRKHFPVILKSHQNHDVVLLCTVCHQLSNQRDSILRYKLADQHNAPIGNATDIKVVVNGDLKVIKSAGNALERNKHVMPSERIEELEEKLKTFFETDDLTPELISKAAVLDVAIVNDSYEPHGLRVFRHYEKIGIIQFEKLWRENFLETMKPEHMPDGWSVTHNHAKLKMKMARYPLDDPVREAYRLALVGSQGHIDVPHIPQTLRVRKTLPSKSAEESSSQSQEEDDGSNSN